MRLLQQSDILICYSSLEEILFLLRKIRIIMKINDESSCHDKKIFIIAIIARFRLQWECPKFSSFKAFIMRWHDFLFVLVMWRNNIDIKIEHPTWPINFTFINKLIFAFHLKIHNFKKNNSMDLKCDIYNIHTYFQWTIAFMMSMI